VVAAVPAVHSASADTACRTEVEIGCHRLVHLALTVDENESSGRRVDAIGLSGFLCLEGCFAEASMDGISIAIVETATLAKRVFHIVALRHQLNAEISICQESVCQRDVALDVRLEAVGLQSALVLEAGPEDLDIIRSSDGVDDVDADPAVDT